MKYIQLNIISFQSTVETIYSAQPSKGFAGALYSFVVRDRKEPIKLLTDFIATEDGERMIKSLINRGNLNFSVMDLDHMTQYNIQDVRDGKATTPDGFQVILPEDDKKPPFPFNLRRKIDRNRENFQRFVYVAESQKHNRVKKLIEQVTSDDKKYIHPLYSEYVEKTPYLKTCVEFGDGDL